MKYMKHLRKLALLSSLALSFTVAYGDGTLPLPGTKVPLILEDAALTETTAASLKLNFSDVLTSVPSAITMPGFEKTCASMGNNFLAGPGTVTAGFSEYDVLGVCVPKTLSDYRRIVLATDGAEVVVLTGTAKLISNSLSEFSGEMAFYPSGATVPSAKTKFVLVPRK